MSMSNQRYTLREMRKISGKTLAQVYEHMNIKKSTLAYWENGSTPIRITFLDRLLKFYGFTINDFDWDDMIQKIKKQSRNASDTLQK